MRTWGLRIVGYGILVAALILAPHFLPETKVTDTQLAYVGAFAIALLGLSILTGITGQISLGHGAFMAIGGYVTAILAVNHGVNEFLTIPLGGIVAGIAGFLFGFPALRLAGVYLALATFALAVAVPAVATSAGSFTGGTAGILLDLPTSPISSLSPEEWLYYVTWGIGAVLYVAAVFFIRGKRGRALRAIRENELAAVSSGISLPQYKTLAFGFSAFYAGVAGSLYAILNFIVTPGTYPVTLSILLLVGLVIGGAGSLLGVVVGAAFVEFVPLYAGDILAPVINFAQKLGLPVNDVDPTTPGVPAVVYGALVLIVLIVMPHGAAGLARRIGSLTKALYSRLIRSGPVTPSRREA